MTVIHLCPDCRSEYDGTRCSCGYVKPITEKLEAPWRSFQCDCCQYPFSYRSFDPTPKVRCLRCAAGRHPLMGLCRFAEETQ